MRGNRRNVRSRMSRRRFLGTAAAGVGATALAGAGVARAQTAPSEAPADVIIYPSGEGNTPIPDEYDNCPYNRVSLVWAATYLGFLEGDPDDLPKLLPGTADVCELQGAVLGVDTDDGCSFWFLGHKFWYAKDPEQPASTSNESLLPSYDDDDNPNYGNNYAGTNIIELAATEGPFYMGLTSSQCVVPSFQVVIPRSLILRGQKTGQYYSSGREKTTEMLNGFHNASVLNFNPDPSSKINVLIKDIAGIGSIANFSGCGGWADVTYENLMLVHQGNFGEPALWGSVAGTWTVKNCYILAGLPIAYMKHKNDMPTGGSSEIVNNDLLSYGYAAYAALPYDDPDDPPIIPIDPNPDAPSPKIKLTDNRIISNFYFAIWIRSGVNIPVVMSANNISVGSLYGVYLGSSANMLLNNEFMGTSLSHMVFDAAGNNIIKSNNFSNSEKMSNCIGLYGAGSQVTENPQLGTKYFPAGSNLCNQVLDVTGQNTIIQYDTLCSEDPHPPEDVRHELWAKFEEHKLWMEQNIANQMKKPWGFPQ